MALHLQFVGRSLLYGYSYLWMIIQIVFPKVYWPNFQETKNRYVLLESSHFSLVLASKKWSWLRSKYNLHFVLPILMGTGSALNIIFLANIIFLNLEVQKPVLKEFGITEESELSYKAIYYAPLLNRICLFSITTVGILTLRNTEWLLYDKYDIFSLGKSFQLKLILTIFLIALLDGIFCHVEAVNFLTHVHPDDYTIVKLFVGVQAYFDIPILTEIELTIQIILNIISFSVRYKPLLNLMYAANCVRAHLANLNDQIMIHNKAEKSGATNERIVSVDSTRLEPDMGTSFKQARYSSTDWSMARADGRGSEQDIYQRSVRHTNPTIGDYQHSGSLFQSTAISSSSSGSTRELLATNSGSSFGLADSSPISGVSLQKWMISDSKSQVATKSDRGTSLVLKSASANSTLESGTIQSGGNRLSVMPPVINHLVATKKPGCVIRNLHELEHHITRLSLFVGDMDRCAAAIVFSMCSLVFIQFIYSVFFMIEYSQSSTRYSHILIGVVCVLTQLAQPLYLFLSGDRMEKEAKKLLAHLEIIYLQDSSQRLIYKQYGGHEMSSLARIIKLLKSIRFNCDSIMNINLGTMKKFILYSVTTMFIVVQYDALNVSYERMATSKNITDFSAAT